MFVLGERCRRLAAERQQSHQLTVASFQQRLQVELAARVDHGLSVRSAPLCRLRQPLQRAQRTLAQVLALEQRPFLERLAVVQEELRQEIATVERHRLAQAFRAGRAGTPVAVRVRVARIERGEKGGHVHDNVASGVELNGIAGGQHKVPGGGFGAIAEGLAQRGQRLAEVLARSAFGHIGPEEGGQA